MSMFSDKVEPLQDLLHVKNTKMYNEYVTAESLDEWISKQATEIR